MPRSIEQILSPVWVATNSHLLFDASMHADASSALLLAMYRKSPPMTRMDVRQLHLKAYWQASLKAISLESTACAAPSVSAMRMPYMTR